MSFSFPPTIIDDEGHRQHHFATTRASGLQDVLMSGARPVLDILTGPPIGSDGERDWVLYICLVVLVVMISALVALPSLKKGRSVMIMGPEDAGKTTLWLRLKDGLVANVGAVVPSVFFKDESFDLELPRRGGVMPARELVNVIDTPSDSDAVENVMGKISRCAAIVFVVDLADEPTWKAAADLLYRLFTADPMRKARVPVIIACNKADKSEAAPLDKLRAALEAEIHRIQTEMTKSAKDKVVNGRSLGPNVTMINLDGQPFTFSSVRAPAPLPSAACPLPQPALTLRRVRARCAAANRRRLAPSRWSSAARCSRKRRTSSSSSVRMCHSLPARPPLARSEKQSKRRCARLIKITSLVRRRQS